jgi:hypothetical protein
MEGYYPKMYVLYEQHYYVIKAYFIFYLNQPFNY